MAKSTGGGGSGGRSGGGGGSGDAGQPGEVAGAANKMNADEAQRAYTKAADKHGDLLIREEEGEKGLGKQIEAALAEKQALRKRITELNGGRF